MLLSTIATQILGFYSAYKSNYNNNNNNACNMFLLQCALRLLNWYIILSIIHCLLFILVMVTDSNSNDYSYYYYYYYYYYYKNDINYNDNDKFISILLLHSIIGFIFNVEGTMFGFFLRRIVKNILLNLNLNIQCECESRKNPIYGTSFLTSDHHNKNYNNDNSCPTMLNVANK